MRDTCRCGSVVRLAGTSSDAHIHMGSCAHLDPAPTYPLTPVLDGVSETMR